MPTVRSHHTSIIYFAPCFPSSFLFFFGGGVCFSRDTKWTPVSDSPVQHGGACESETGETGEGEPPRRSSRLWHSSSSSSKSARRRRIVFCFVFLLFFFLLLSFFSGLFSGWVCFFLVARMIDLKKAVAVALWPLRFFVVEIFWWNSWLSRLVGLWM